MTHVQECQAHTHSSDSLQSVQVPKVRTFPSLRPPIYGRVTSRWPRLPLLKPQASLGYWYRPVSMLYLRNAAKASVPQVPVTCYPQMIIP